MESDSRIDTLREALIRLIERGLGLGSGDYIIGNKRDGRHPFPSEADYILALSHEPLEGDEALSLSWPNILRRLRVSLLEWWQAWDDSVEALRALPREADHALSRAFNEQWRLRLSKVLVEVGGAVGSARPPETELDLSAFVFSRLPPDWRDRIDQIANFADELLAAQNVREERENREVSPPPVEPGGGIAMVRKRGTKAKRTRKIDVAITIVVRKPELTDAEVAKEARCDPSYLSKNEDYRRNAEMARKAAASQKRQATFDRRTRTVEAISTDPEGDD